MVVTYDADFDYGIKVLINCQNQSNSMTSSFWKQWKHEIADVLVIYETEIWYIEVIFHADFNYATEIRMDRQNRSNLRTSSFWRQWKYEIANILATKWSMKLKFAM